MSSFTDHDSQLVLGEDGGGPRWYLAGRPVYTGSGLEIQLANGSWVHCRLEGKPAYGRARLEDIFFDHSTIPAEGRTLRWPE